MSSALNTVARPVHQLRRSVVKALFERGDFLDTGVNLTPSELGLTGDSYGYSPSRWSLLPRALMRQRITDRDVFVDFGSGMGRTVCQAASRPFGRVIGIELSEQLNRVARENIARNRHRFASRNVEIVAGDALDFEIPDDMTYAFFFNPFRGETFRTVIERILASLDRVPRKLTLIYVNPCEGDYLLSTGRFVRSRRLKGLRRRDDPTSWVDVFVTPPPRS